LSQLSNESRCCSTLTIPSPYLRSGIPNTQHADLAVEARFLPVRSSAELQSAFREFTGWRAEGVAWLAGKQQAFMTETIELAAKRQHCSLRPTKS
jgi:hypothetical protein